MNDFDERSPSDQKSRFSASNGFCAIHQGGSIAQRDIERSPVLSYNRPVHSFEMKPRGSSNATRIIEEDEDEEKSPSLYSSSPTAKVTGFGFSPVDWNSIPIDPLLPTTKKNTPYVPSCSRSTHCFRHVNSSRPDNEHFSFPSSR
jgi:hypothetical protein